ncbi:MAG: tripartite tricarboxylate transporter TctB family protein [Pseudomonadota bacterium]
MLAGVKTLKQLFQRYRRPGNYFFASIFLLFSLALLSQLTSEAQWIASTNWSSQPALWPAIALVGMTVFAALNWISAVVSPRIEGRWVEVSFWLKAFEFVLWFMVYVVAVPLAGYLPSTVIFAIFLSLRMGYTTPKMLTAAGVTGVAVVLIFKTFLQVKVPGGQFYELFPDTMRAFMLTNF